MQDVYRQRVLYLGRGDDFTRRMTRVCEKYAALTKRTRIVNLSRSRAAIPIMKIEQTFGVFMGALGYPRRPRESINIGSDRCSLQAGVNMILRLCESAGEALGDPAGEMRRHAGQANRQKHAVLNA